MSSSDALVTPAVLGDTLAAAGWRESRYTLADRLGWTFLLLTVLAWSLGAVVGPKTPLLLLVLLAMGSLVYGWIQPAVGLFGLGIWCTLDPAARFFLFDSGLPHSTFNYVLAVVIVLYLPFLLRLRNGPCVIWQLFALLVATQLTYSPDLHLGFARLMSVICPFAMLVYFVRTCRDAQVWYWVAVVNSVTSMLAIPVIYVTENAEFGAHRSTFSYLPTTAIYSAILAYLCTPANSRKAIALFILALINFVLVLMIGGRGAAIIGSLCMLYFLIELRSVGQRLTTWGLVGIAILVACLLFPSRVGYTVARIASLANPELTLRSRTSGRYDLAVGGWQIALNHPFGVGTGGFDTAWIRLDLYEGMSGFNAGVKVAGGAHAAWIETLTENGFPGVLLHMAFPVALVISAWKSRQKALLRGVLLAAGALVLTHGSRDWWEKGIWFFVMGMTVMLYREEMIAALYRSVGRRVPQALAVPATGEARSGH